MPLSATVSDALTEVTTRVKTGDLKSAKQELRKLNDHGDTRALAVIAWCVQTLNHDPATALARLDHAMATAPSAEDRALVTACRPDDTEYHARPETQPEPDTARAPRWNARTKQQAPRDDRRRVDPHARRDAAQRRDARQRRQESAPVTAYHAERAGVNDQPERAEPIPGYAHDYDKAAVPDQHGAACLYCRMERSRADHTHGAEDDGLCGECRELGVEGMPALPTGEQRAPALRARLSALIADDPAHGTRAVNAEWHRARSRADRAAITAYADEHRAAILRARLAALIEHDPAHGPQIINTEWRHARSRADRATITAYAHEHRAQIQRRARSARCDLDQASAALNAAIADHQHTHPAPSHVDRADPPHNGQDAAAGHQDAAEDAVTLPPCGTCGEARTLRDVRHVEEDDTLCAACRALDTAPLPELPAAA